jgi:hypothetical protein
MTGPGLLAAQMDGLSRELTQTNTVQFTLGYQDPAQVMTLPAGAEWLYNQVQEISPNQAEEVAAVVRIGEQNVVFENSTSIWVGCDDSVHTATFYLEGNYTELSFALALQQHTPEGMSAEFLIQTLSEDYQRYVLPWNYGVTAGDWVIERGTIVERQTIDVTGIWAIAIYSATDGVCGSADIGYGAMLDAYVK